jgi:hypothetical protein
MKEAAHINAIEQARAAKLLTIFGAIDAAVAAGEAKGAVIKRLAALHNRELVAAINGQSFELKLSAKTLERLYYAHQAQPGTWTLVRKYGTPSLSIPDELVAEIRRRCTGGGADGRQASAPTVSSVVRNLLKEWDQGAPIKGLGTWQEWWQTNHPAEPMPARAPKFPFHPSTLYRYAPRKKSALSAAGNIGLAAALDHLMSVERDSSRLRPGEVYVADDVRLDLICMCSMTRRRVEVRAYVMMDWATRRVVAYTMRAGNALNADDVRALIARGLSVGGIRPLGETTHIFLERGTCVLSAEDAAHLELLTNHRIKVHQTGMISAERWKGAGKDKPVGNFRGKAVLESFFRRLHIALGGLPGQRGNRYEAMPRNLDMDGHNSRSRTKDSLTAYAERLAELEHHYQGRLRLELPLLWDSQLEQHFAQAIKDLNATRGHGMQGFGTVTVFVNPVTGETRDLTDTERDALSLQAVLSPTVVNEGTTR